MWFKINLIVLLLSPESRGGNKGIIWDINHSAISQRNHAFLVPNGVQEGDTVSLYYKLLERNIAETAHIISSNKRTAPLFPTNLTVKASLAVIKFLQIIENFKREM